MYASRGFGKTSMLLTACQHRSDDCVLLGFRADVGLQLHQCEKTRLQFVEPLLQPLQQLDVLVHTDHHGHNSVCAGAVWRRLRFGGAAHTCVASSLLGGGRLRDHRGHIRKAHPRGRLSEGLPLQGQRDRRRTHGQHTHQLVTS